MTTLAQQLACARRELALRRNVYPKWVASGRMRQEVATREIECMEGVVHTVERALSCEEVTNAILHPEE